MRRARPLLLSCTLRRAAAAAPLRSGLLLACPVPLEPLGPRNRDPRRRRFTLTLLVHRGRWSTSRHSRRPRCRCAALPTACRPRPSRLPDRAALAQIAPRAHPTARRLLGAAGPVSASHAAVAGRGAAATCRAAGAPPACMPPLDRCSAAAPPGSLGSRHRPLTPRHRCTRRRTSTRRPSRSTP